MPSVTRLASYAQLAWHAHQLRSTSNEQVRARARRHLVERLGKMRGLPQKLGQLLSVADATPDDFADDLTTLQDNGDPSPWAQIEPLLAAAWQCPIHQVLSDIDPHGHAASLGQVHQAITREGQQVAIKVQYPGIREALDTDLSLLGWLSIPVGNLRRGFDLAAYRRVLLDDLNRELDYEAEAAWQARFADWAAKQPALIIPDVVPELCAPQVLVSHWTDGDAWSDVQADWSEADRMALAGDLLKVFFEGLFLRGMLHADLHPGNLRFRRTPQGTQVVLYDFGCIYAPQPSQRVALLRLIRATRQRDESPWPFFLQLGFDPDLLAPLASRLPAICQLLFEPFTTPHAFNLQDWRLSERLSDVLGEDRWNFRVAGSPELIFLLRAFHGLSYYLRGLQTPVSWSRALGPCLDSLKDDLDALPTGSPPPAPCAFQSLARHLKIRVTERDQLKAQLTIPASSIDDLSALLDEDLLAKIRQRGIALEEVARDVRRRSYAAGEVFTLEESPRKISVWLE